MDDKKSKRGAANADSDGEGENEMRNESSSEDEVEDGEDAKTTKKFTATRDDLEPEAEEVEQSEDEEEEKSDDDEALKREDGDEPDADETKVADETKIEEEDEIKAADESKIVNKTKVGRKTSKNKSMSVVDNHNYAQDYREDSDKYLWCEITFGLPLNFRKLDLTALLKDVASKSVVWETPGIKRAFLLSGKDVLTLKTDGVNIVEMFKHNTILDLSRLYCNDVHQFAETYGIEAASKIIVKEVKDVFDVYSIKVDPRHLSLIADFMTFNGTFEPMSRKGMESSPSPLQQMSFESSLAFLKNAVMRGKRDDLQNPSSSLMVGKPIRTGSGCFSLLQKINKDEFQ